MKLIIYISVSCILVVLAHGASLANESLNKEEANKFLSRSKRDLWEECALEGCNTEEVWESMKKAGRSRSENVREFLYLISYKKNREQSREFVSNLFRMF